jgi:hypothetical protein
VSMDWLKAIAPTVATVLGGPLAGLAVEAIGSALGMSDATQERVTSILQSGQMTSEQIAAVKQAEIALVAKLKELDIKIEEIHAGDRSSARKMQADTKSRIPGVLAILITAGFFGILIGMMTGGLKATGNSDALLIMLGALGAAWGAVVNFYYGSSRGSDEKTAMLARK